MYALRFFRRPPSRIKNITFFLDKKGKFDAETIPLSKVWWRQDINDAQLYLMPPLSLAGRLYHYVSLTYRVCVCTDDTRIGIAPHRDLAFL